MVGGFQQAPPPPGELPKGPSGIQLLDYSAIVVGDHLYIDGGITVDLISGRLGEGPNYHTLSVSLTESWRGDAVPFQHSAKPDDLRNTITMDPLLWTQDDHSMFSWGAWAAKGDSLIQRDVWQFTPDGQGTGQWKETDQEYGASIAGPTYVTYLDDAMYYLTVAEEEQLAAFNWSNPTWSYQPLDPAVSKYGSNVVGLPKHGQGGILVFIGGGDKTPSEVTVYDPSTQSWYTQATSGDVPHSRSYVGLAMAESHDGTFEILMHSGVQHNRTMRYNPETSSDAWVLSIPAFHWFKVSGGFRNQNQQGFSTCKYAGGGQVIALDGIYWNGKVSDSDNTIGPVGVVDLSHLSWKQDYAPNPRGYWVANEVAQYYYENSPRNIKWAAPEVQSLFVGADAPKTRFWATSGNTVTSPGVGVNAGVVAGGVIGGVLGVAVLLVLFFWIRRRRSKGRSNLNSHGSNSRTTSVEDGRSAVRRSDEDRFEKAELPANDWPLSGSQGSAELDGAPVHALTVDRPARPVVAAPPPARVADADEISPLPPSAGTSGGSPQTARSGPGSSHAEMEGSLAERFELDSTPRRSSLQPPPGPQEPRQSHSTDELYGE